MRHRSRSATSGYVAQLQHAESLIVASLTSLTPLAVGGTAVGTGLNTHPEFGARVATELADRNGIPFTSAANKFAATGRPRWLNAAHGALKDRKFNALTWDIAGGLRMSN